MRERIRAASLQLPASKGIVDRVWSMVRLKSQKSKVKMGGRRI